MADTFDPYRERLIVETETIWPDALEALTPMQRTAYETQLHASPDKAAHLDYLRMHTGFCRRITVTQADLDRLAS